MADVHPFLFKCFYEHHHQPESCSMQDEACRTFLCILLKNVHGDGMYPFLHMSLSMAMMFR